MAGGNFIFLRKWGIPGDPLEKLDQAFMIILQIY